MMTHCIILILRSISRDQRNIISLNEISNYNKTNHVGLTVNGPNRVYMCVSKMITLLDI